MESSFVNSSEVYHRREKGWGDERGLGRSLDGVEVRDCGEEGGEERERVRADEVRSYLLCFDCVLRCFLILPLYSKH